MNRGKSWMMTVGLLSGSLLVVGCFAEPQEEGAGRPNTPIQQKYQGGTTGVATEHDDNREGLTMPDWQNHPTMEEDEESWRADPSETSPLGPRTPTIPAPEPAYQAADDVLAPRAGEGTPEVEPNQGRLADEEEAIGGAGAAGQQPDRGTPDAGTRR